ncbi:MAG: hypothetical protein M3137_05170 [Actinomycetota bacterium]|nr:hypothetical protein [Actinomycetota bacterium]
MDDLTTALGPPATTGGPARHLQALGDLGDELLGWRRAVAVVFDGDEPIDHAEGRLGDSGAAVASSEGGAEVTDGAVDDAVAEMDRLRRGADEADAALRSRAQSLERSTRYVQSTVVRWRAHDQRPQQLAEAGNDAAGQAAHRLGGCHRRRRALADGFDAATAALSDARTWQTVEHQALDDARQAWARGAGHLGELRASSPVAAAGDAASEWAQRCVTRIVAAQSALVCYDQPADWAASP